MTTRRWWRYQNVDISEICDVAGDAPAVVEALAGLDRTEIEALIQQALHPAVPVGVLFAALDRYTAQAVKLAAEGRL